MSERPQPTRAAAVFLDRDGVVNEEVHLLHRPDQLRLTPGAGQAIRRLNQAGFRVVVATNQSVVARGMCTEEELGAIHDALREMLRAEGADLDAVYYCPHHRNADLPEYRCDCPDRKPNPGMLLRAEREFGVRLADSYMVGDRTSDIRAGAAAGVETILVETGFGGSDAEHDVRPDARCRNLAEAADYILKHAASIKPPASERTERPLRRPA